MTVQELLIPRIRVKAEYPYCQYEKGTILIKDETTEELYSAQFGYTQSKFIVKWEDAGKYPHIFRVLEWWEDREISELPEYVKYTEQSARHLYNIDKVGVYKPAWEMESGNPMFSIKNKVYSYGLISAQEVSPITEEEYNEQAK